MRPNLPANLTSLAVGTSLLAAMGILGGACAPLSTQQQRVGFGPSGERIGWAEPTIPPPCITLVADKTAVNGTLSDADEARADTKRIQDAILDCPEGQAVRLVAGANGKDAFMSGPLRMVSQKTLWVDKGVTLFASRNPRDFDIGNGMCGTDAYDDSGGCQPLILVEDVYDVGVVGEGTIDGRGGEPMIGGTATWWDVAQDAKVKSLKHSNPRLIDVRGKAASNFTLYKVTLVNSPKFHVVIRSRGFVVWGVTVMTPSRPFNSLGKPLSPHYARNTDGIDPSNASDGVMAYNYISTGDDQIAIKGGNSGPTQYVTIKHNHFGTGHGMSIGSETNGGVNNILVEDLSIDGAVDSGGMPRVDLNGIRIKSDSSRGGLVERITYRDVCIRDMVNPILLSPHYSKATGGMIPEYKGIRLENVRALRTPGTKADLPVVMLKGYDAEHMLDLSLDNVVVEGLQPNFVKAEFADVKLGPGPVNVPIAGPHVTVSDVTPGVAAAPNPCTGKFVPPPVIK